jgi:hypothetical protein
MSDVEEYQEYHSGPFCRHFGDPSDCDEVCLSCGHHCCKHDYCDPYACMECECSAWKEIEGVQEKLL